MRRIVFPAFAVLLFLAGPEPCARTAELQDERPLSIHQLQSEAYRDFEPARVPGPKHPSVLRRPAAPNLSRSVFGFYPYWATGFSQLRFGGLTHLAYFSAEADGAGRLTNLRGWPNTALVDAAHRANVRVVLACTLFNSTQLGSLLSSSSARQALIGNLREQVLAGGADGVNIDFEGVPGSQRTNLVTFMQELAAEMRAAVPGAHISIDTPAVDWSNAFDYAALADACDALMIMCYDYYWRSAPNAGPVSPLSGSTLWGSYSVRWTIADYLTKVGPSSAGKLIMGIPYYGYDWPTQDDQLKSRATGQATARLYSAAAETAEAVGRRWDATSSTPWYFYNSQGPRQCWYDDAQSLSAKYDLVFENSLQGVGIWALTYDNGRSELGDLIDRRFGVPRPPDAPEISAPSEWFETTSLPARIRPTGAVPAVSFEVAVGTSPGGKEVRDFRSTGRRQHVLIGGLSLTPGRTYHLTARSVDESGGASVPGNSVPVRIDPSPAPVRRYIPSWVSSSELYTGLALVNSSSETRAVLIRGKLEGVAEPVETAWVLTPGAQMAQVLTQEELLGPSVAGKSGWLELRFRGEGLGNMYLVGDSRVSRLLAGGPLLQAGSAWILPETDSGRMVVSLANPGAETASVRLELNREDGSQAARTVSLAAGAGMSARIGELFPEAAPPAADSASSKTPWVRLNADAPVACTSTLQRDGDSASLPALAEGGALKSGSISYVVFGGGFRTDAIFVNPSGEPVTLELQLLGAGSAGKAVLEVPARGALRSGVAEMFGFTPGSRAIGGALMADVVRGPGILGTAWIRSEDFRIMAALGMEPGGSTRHVFPQLAQTQGYWTGVSIANPGGAAVSVTVEAIDASGASLGKREMTLQAGEVRIGLVFEWIAATLGVASGRVEIRSSGAVLACEIFGSDTLSFMASIPGR